MSDVPVSTQQKTRSPKPGMSKARRDAIGRAWRLAVIFIAIAYALYPVIYILSASLDPIGRLGGGIMVDNPSLANYRELFERDYWRWMFNSVVVATITSVLSVLVSAISAYAFSRFRFVGRRSMLLAVFLVQVFPNTLSMVATYLLIQLIGQYIPMLGLNTLGGLILVYLGGAMGINTWLMKGFFDTVPRDLDESAKIDGATDWQIFWLIIMPLVRPVLAVVAILAFVTTYADYLLALVLVTDERNYTLAVGLSRFVGNQFTQRWGVFAAGALIGAVPIIIIYLVLQDFIVGGLTAGSVKG
jgi:arabinogalactan oligomer / maltooligosaccharide transport system permease protein